MHSAVTKLSETVKDSQVHPQTSVLAFIRLPVVNARKQNRPTRTAKEIEKIITRPGIGISCLAYRVPILSEAVSDWAILAVHLGPPLSLLSRISERSSQTGPQMRVGTEDRAQLDVILPDQSADAAAAIPIRDALKL